MDIKLQLLSKGFQEQNSLPVLDDLVTNIVSWYSRQDQDEVINVYQMNNGSFTVELDRKNQESLHIRNLSEEHLVVILDEISVMNKIID